MEAASKRGKRKAVHRGVELVCSLQFEEQALAAGHAVVAGVDEVGRGALCGPVVAAAVVLGQGFVTDGIDDSKRLTARQRVQLDARIRTQALGFGIGIADHEEIDRVNILRATLVAMKRAVLALPLFDVFDFELSADELAAIDALDTGVRGGPEPEAVTMEAFGRPIPEA